MEDFTLYPEDLEPASNGRHVDLYQPLDAPPRVEYASAYIVPLMGGRHRG